MTVMLAAMFKRLPAEVPLYVLTDAGQKLLDVTVAQLFVSEQTTAATFKILQLKISHVVVYICWTWNEFSRVINSWEKINDSDRKSVV